MQRRWWFILVVLAQILFLVVMIGTKWSTLAYGDKVMLKTAPVDPWDVFRGDYVVLNYEISNLDLNVIPDGKEEYKRNDTVYVVLEQKEKYWEARSVSHKQPDNGDLAIKGTVLYLNEYDNEKSLMVEYGINSYYVPQHKGRDIENARVSLDVEVSVDSRGNSAISRIFIEGEEVKFQ